MAARTKLKISQSIAARAKQVLEFAEQRAQTATDWLELHRAIYGVDGKASKLFTTEQDRTAFEKTKESRRIGALMDKLPAPPVAGYYPPRSGSQANGRSNTATRGR